MCYDQHHNTDFFYYFDIIYVYFLFGDSRGDEQLMVSEGIVVNNLDFSQCL
jgi:hypothetical protein